VRGLYIRQMQTALHIQTLVLQLRKEIVGGRITSTEFYKKERAAYIFVRRAKTLNAFGFVYHPAGAGCFCVPASKVKIETREKPWPIFSLTEGEITGVGQDGLDRIFRVHFSGSEGRRTMLFEALGPNGNIWLLDEDGRRLATLRHKQFNEGEPYAAADPGDRLDPREVSLEQIRELFAQHGHASAIGILKKRLHGFNETMVREVLKRVDTAAPKDDAAAGSLAKEIRNLAERFASVDNGYLYSVKGADEVYPCKLSLIEEQPEKYKTLSLAVLALIGRRRTIVEEEDEEKKVLQAVSRAVKKLQRRLSNLEKDLAKAAGFEEYKKHAELLQLNREKLKRGMERITVEDLLGDSSEEVEIELDSALTPNENIEALFKRHRKGREGLDLLERRKQITADELAALESMQSELEADFASAARKYESDLVSLMPRESDKQAATPRLPYRPITLSTGLTVFVGRDGADNDRTTFEFTRPYELWFHTQQCPGSHVVMKFPNKMFEPSKVEIEETAALAAYHSKARHDSLVPVIYTQRKYVRKPRKAKPGLVLVEREKSIMVVPRKGGE